ncbi:PPC domain-containing DNA-binding protein [uncultured Ilyobacter sp.]|uniref:PPC domain-containing DNA-binding protein n=1 Tax=uncultured Ilyobacter sp. TaxID=544433 RepID=UPI0029F469CB|nr:PPC domain-containing DNA-binding protein [uncultured Ilyobacter sp.]
MISIGEAESIKIHCVRLKKGDDVKKFITNYSAENNIQAGVILSSVGCVINGRIRLADGKSIREFQERLEIISINGTLSPDGSHLHISYSDRNGIVFGGHLVEGNIINTTCELVIGEFCQYSFKRSFDKKTGYKEIEIIERE